MDILTAYDKNERLSHFMVSGKSYFFLVTSCCIPTLRLICAITGFVSVNFDYRFVNSYPAFSHS